MPHMCTRCKSVFEDGMDVLEGCPVCGWKKFLFVKSKDKIGEVEGALQVSRIGGIGGQGGTIELAPEAEGSLRRKNKKAPGRNKKDAPTGDKTEVPTRNKDAPTRDKKTGRPDGGRNEGTIRKGKPRKKGKGTLGFFDLDSRTERSNSPAPRGSQKDRIDEDKSLESIRMPEPGTYELNLPSLFEREELVMAIKEGTYLIDLSSAFKKSKKS